jgi:hypothetical protein
LGCSNNHVGALYAVTADGHRSSGLFVGERVEAASNCEKLQGSGSDARDSELTAKAKMKCPRKFPAEGIAFDHAIGGYAQGPAAAISG